MRRFLISILLACSLLFGAVAPMSAAAAEWPLASFANGTVTVVYTIDINNLQVDHFTVNNATAQAAFMYIETDGAVTFTCRGEPLQVTTCPIANFKFRRLPATDHDDPNSIRYPQGVSIGARFPAE